MNDINKTRSQIDVLWLLEKKAWEPDPLNNNRIIFKGAKPPTAEQVYLNFRGHHNFLQALTKNEVSSPSRTRDIWAILGIFKCCHGNGPGEGVKRNFFAIS